MSDSELAIVSVDSFATPTLITRAWPSTRKKVLRIFYGPDPQRAVFAKMVFSP
jgi:hypothetical protein